MYLEEAHDQYQGTYLECAALSLTEDPTVAPDLQTADQFVSTRQYFKALRTLKKLIQPDAFMLKQGPSDNYVPRHNGWKKKAG
jgi:flagellar biosynthesis regulator FlbT